MNELPPFAHDPRLGERTFAFGWGARPATADDVAAHLTETVERLAEIEPAWAEVRFLFEMRALRASDPGPVLTLGDDLARRIDRRGRFEAPAAPRPVGPWGYSFVLDNQRKEDDPLYVALFIGAGATAEEKGNQVYFKLPAQHPMWRDVEQGLRVLRLGAAVWRADCAQVSALVPEGQYLPRPWLNWTRHGAPPLPVLSGKYLTYPAEYEAFPHETREAFGGLLKVWP
ncbi:hypothetical protein [Phenylobacterium sp.]|jgi:hypothetical protein|uniref:hypothetical protein n=1 Tax=Phenylobacterium sp. TaxID=1871053 RepID=UPI002F949FC4